MSPTAMMPWVDTLPSGPVRPGENRPSEWDVICAELSLSWMVRPATLARNAGAIRSEETDHSRKPGV